MGRLLIVMAAEVVGVGVTHHLSGPFRSTGWVAALAAADVASAVVAVVHLAAWAAAWWVLAGTLHDVVVALGGARRGAVGPTGRRLAPAWSQRVVNQAVATALVVGAAAGPASAATAVDLAPVVQVVSPPVPVIAQPPRIPHHLPDPTVGAPTPTEVQPAPAEPALVQPAPAEPALAQPTPAEATHVVASGENLWVIARGALVRAGTGTTPPTDREVHAHWVRLVQINEVSSGDPDLIHPGEVLVLPALPSSGQPSDGGSS